MKYVIVFVLFKLINIGSMQLLSSCQKINSRPLMLPVIFFLEKALIKVYGN